MFLPCCFTQGDGILGLYTSATLREFGYETVYCSGNRIQRSEFITRFGAIPLYKGRKYFYHSWLTKLLIYICLYEYNFCSLCIFRQAKYDRKNHCLIYIADFAWSSFFCFFLLHVIFLLKEKCVD